MVGKISKIRYFYPAINVLKFCIIPLFKFNSLQKAFHDCVGPDGCDGCLNLDDPDNVGLSDIITVLTDLRAGNYQRYDSFADVMFQS